MTGTDPAELRAGYAFRQGKGVADYAGVLRRIEQQVWRCEGPEHRHLTATSAIRCAETELERRREAAKVILVLLRCSSCDIYFGHGAAARPQGRDRGECSSCDSPLDPVRVVVL